MSDMDDLYPVLERLARAWERQAAAEEAIAASWALSVEQLAERIALEHAAAKRDEAWRSESEAARAEDIARRKVEREEDRQFVLDKENRDRAGWLGSLSNLPR